MPGRRTLKLIHLAGTMWFALSAAYILVLALRQAGVRWWVIFSLSGYSAVLAFLLLSLYLFAIYRGAVRSQEPGIEHPLTSTHYYMIFYGLSPFLGGLAGALGMLGVSKVSHFVLGIVLGTLIGTFLVWIIIDPAIGLAEMLLPGSREHRVARLAQMKAQREEQHKRREQVLAELEMQDELNRKHWQKLLEKQAEDLAALAASAETGSRQAEQRAIDIGVSAWQLGGLECMQELYHMARQARGQDGGKIEAVDHISIWWDGIGSWRNAPLAEKEELGHG